MTIQAWIGWGIISILIFIAAVFICVEAYNTSTKVFTIVIAAILIIGMLLGGLWYYGNTASGIRELTDEKANFQNGLERTITIYTADGTILKQYEGKIDIEQDQGYVKFDWNGKRYIYYNCYIETIGDIK